MRKRCGNVIFFIQVSLDELDGIQQELEAALSAVVVRQEMCRSTMTSSTFFFHFRSESESCVKRVMWYRTSRNIEAASKRYFF